MYSYFNDVSAGLNQPGTDSFKVFDELIQLLEHLKEDYKIEYLKVPANFADIKIGGTSSFNELIDQAFSNGETERAIQIITLLANHTSSGVTEINEKVEAQMDKGLWVEIKHQDKSSFTLTGAYLLRRPAVSLNTTAGSVDRLNCVYHLEDVESGNTHKSDVYLKNLYHLEQTQVHKDDLIDIKRQILFARIAWDPKENRIWNDKTKEMLKDLKFPECVTDENKIDKLLVIGGLVAQLNGWRRSHYLSSLNTTGHKIREIYESVGGRHRTYYLSIDVKNKSGTFELCGPDGKHMGEIAFEDGRYIPRGGDAYGRDTTGGHDIKLERGKKK